MSNGWKLRKEEKILDDRGRRLLQVRLKKELSFLGFLFFVLPPPNVQNCPLCILSCGPIFIGKILFGPQNWSLNFLCFFIFINFDFSCICFLKTSNINVDSNEKNQ